MNVNFAVFWLMLFMLISAALVTGFTCGFGGFLAYVCGVSLVAYGYWRLVVNRPRVAPQRAFVGVYDGLSYYMDMEVV
jgi:hypothetical protein